MRTFLKTLLLFACLISVNCFHSNQGIEEISHNTVSRDHKGDGYFSEVKFRKDGFVETNEGKLVHDQPAEKVYHKGKITTEQFEKLADVISNTNFFSTEEKGIVTDYSDAIDVVYSKGNKSVQVRALNNNDQKAIMDRLQQMNKQIVWETGDYQNPK